MQRAHKAFVNFHELINFDRLYVGRGNASELKGHLDSSLTIVGNIAGILGGIKLRDLPGD